MTFEDFCEKSSVHMESAWMSGNAYHVVVGPDAKRYRVYCCEDNEEALNYVYSKYFNN